MLWGGGVDIASIVRCEPMELPMQTLNDLSRSRIAFEPASTLIAVIEMSLSSWKWRKQDAGSNALSLPSRPAVTASGWHAGSRRAV